MAIIGFDGKTYPSVEAMQKAMQQQDTDKLRQIGIDKGADEKFFQSNQFQQFLKENPMTGIYSAIDTPDAYGFGNSPRTVAMAKYYTDYLTDTGQQGRIKKSTEQSGFESSPVGRGEPILRGDPRFESRPKIEDPQQYAGTVGLSPQQPKNANTLPDYEAFKKYQSTIPNNMFRASSAVIVPRRLADGTVVNFGSPLQAEDYDNYLKSIGKPPTTSVDSNISDLGRVTPPETPKGNTNMAQSTPVTDIQKTIEERAGATTLPTGTQYVPEVQQVQREELLTPPNPLDTTDAVSPSLVSTENLDVTVPSQQNAEKYTASTIPGTPEAVAAQGKLSSESVIGDVQGAVSKESLVQAAQGKVSEQSTVKYQLEQLFSSFEEGKPLPAWAAPAVRNVGAMMQARGLGASSMASAAITQAIMESGIPIAKADADRYGQMDMANLSNQQQAVMQNAMTYASMDKANLDARMQVAVNNAKSFLSMDLQNLNNEQKMQEIDYAGQMQALTSNQAAENSAAQFNAQSQNQIDEFFAELGAQIETGNVNRRAAQDQFNVNEKNAIAQYNASLSDARERFNTTMATQIAQSNAVWRREINTAETANQNAANQMNVQNLLGITQASLDALWQRYRDEAGWALKIAESQEQRFHEIGLLSMEIDANTDLYEMESDATFSTELGKAVLNGIFKVGTAYVSK